MNASLRTTRAQFMLMLVEGGDKSAPLPSLDAIERFLEAHYKTSHFRERDGSLWGRYYSRHVAEEALETLVRRGLDCVAKHDSVSGEDVWFDRALRVFEIVDEREAA